MRQQVSEELGKLRTSSVSVREYFSTEGLNW